MAEPKQTIPLERIGRVLILAGVAVWVVFGIVWVLGGNPQAKLYVPFHLSGVLPGAVLARWQAIAGWVRRRRPAAR